MVTNMSDGLLEKFNWGDEELTLKQQADLVDHYLHMTYSMLNETFPELDMWTTGSVLTNSHEIGCSEGVKTILLTKEQREKFITKCFGCGREHTVEMKKHILERMIELSKEHLRQTKEANGQP